MITATWAIWYNSYNPPLDCGLYVTVVSTFPRFPCTMETLRRVCALLCNTCASSAMPLKSEMGSYSFPGQGRCSETQTRNTVPFKGCEPKTHYCKKRQFILLIVIRSKRDKGAQPVFCRLRLWFQIPAIKNPVSSWRYAGRGTKGYIHFP